MMIFVGLLAACVVTGLCAFWLGYNKGVRDADAERQEFQAFYLTEALSTDERHGAMRAFDYLDTWLP